MDVVVHMTVDESSEDESRRRGGAHEDSGRLHDEDVRSRKRGAGKCSGELQLTSGG